MSSLSRRQTGYCTNVHAGTDLESIRRNLSEYAVPVRESLRESSGTDQLGVGLWIPDQASRELGGQTLSDFGDFLTAEGLVAYTINGFPFDNFHIESVKQRVYLPTWADPERLRYTQRLAEILAGLLPDDQSLGSISTLPIGWPDNPFASESESADVKEAQVLEIAGQQFRVLTEFLRQLESRTGKRIVVAIEPEPGCLLDTVDDMLAFFSSQLDQSMHRNYISVCHDICHSSVMNEGQRQVIERYAEAGIPIGKVQVSNAIVVNWSSIPVDQRGDALRQLSEFAEDRYLHQTGQVDNDGGFRLTTDLPELLSETRVEDLDAVDRWVIHFHVPIFLDQFELLSTSRGDVIECLQALDDPDIDVDFTGHLEVETYAWTVLPESLRQRGLSQDIASELAWLSGLELQR